MRKFIFVILGIAMLTLVSSKGKSPSSQTYFFNYENVLGTSFNLKVVAVSEEVANYADQVALNEIERLSDILSSYDPSSEFRLWQNTMNKDIKVSPELFEVLSLFEIWESRTDGALTASAAVSTELWNKAAEKQVLPDQEELSKAVSAMEKTHWELNIEKQTARHLSTDPLVLNTFVKSYIINKTSEEIMDVPGIAASVINIGGDIVIAGNVPETIRVANPTDDAENSKPVSILQLNNRAIATSGNYRRGYRISDEWFSHIIDARTAIPAKGIISATVVADNPTDAGALATAFNILLPEESEAIARQMKDVEYLLVTGTGQHISSDGWGELEFNPVIEKSADLIQHTGVTDGAASDFELDIEIELSRFQGRYARPYIAVWIENEKMEHVSTLALWINSHRWLPDLRRWYSKNYSITQQSDIMQSISSATRSAGKYTLNWDCKDYQGNLQESGKFTIYIEAVREHGTYQLIKSEIGLNGQPKRVDLQGGTEISSATVNYHEVVKNNTSI